MKKISLIVGFLVIVSFIPVSATSITDQIFVEIAEQTRPLIGQLSIVLIPKSNAIIESQNEDDELEGGAYLDRYGIPRYGYEDKNKDLFSQNDDSDASKLRDQLKKLRQNNGDAPKKKVQKKEKERVHEFELRKRTYKLGRGVLIDKNGLFLILARRSGIYYKEISDNKRYDVVYQILVNDKSYQAELVSIHGKLMLWRVRGLQDIQFKPLIFSKNTQIKLGQWITIIGKYQGDRFLKIGHIGRKRLDSFYIDSYGQDYDIIGGLVISLKKEIIGIIQENYNREIKAVLIDQVLITELIKSSKSKILGKEKSWFGVSFAQLNKEIYHYLRDQVGLDIRQEKGVVVRNFPLSGSPANQAGIRKGDIIKSINGEPVNDLETVRELVEAVPPGQILTLEIIAERTGRIKNLQARTVKKEPYHYFLRERGFTYPGVVY